MINLFKENIEKSKKVLKEHFEQRKQKREEDLIMLQLIKPNFNIYNTFDINMNLIVMILLNQEIYFTIN